MSTTARRPVRVGVIGTSWWADSMYLPALRGVELSAPGTLEVAAVAGRDPERAQAFADKWSIPLAVTDPTLLYANDLDCVIVASSNDSHHPLTMEALAAGLDVLCEKPLALDTPQAREMTLDAADRGAITMVPFTYRFMPTNQWLERLVRDGYIGTPHHLDMRYYTGFARGGEYAWRFDNEFAGSGLIGDLGTHWLHLARWFFGEVVEIGAFTSTIVDRASRPDGSDYERGEDAAVLNVRFASGAYGSLHISAVCHEPTAFGQTHHIDLHGSDGTLRSTVDWDSRQEVVGVRADETGPPKPLPIPADIWGQARSGSVHDTYRDVFRRNGAMVGDFVQAVRTRVPCQPDFAEGLRVQELVDAALRSAADGARMMPV